MLLVQNIAQKQMLRVARSAKIDMHARKDPKHHTYAFATIKPRVKIRAMIELNHTENYISYKAMAKIFNTNQNTIRV